MSTNARLTLIGLTEYDTNLFDKLSLPEGYDKETFVDTLLLEHGEKCVLYSNPLFFKDAIGAWSRKWAHELARIYLALTEEYNPLHNYDRHEEYTDAEHRTLDSQGSAGHTAIDKPNFNEKQTNDLKNVSETNRDSEVEHLISADNSGSYQPQSKDISDGGKNTDTNTGTVDKVTSGTTQNLDEKSNSKSLDDENRLLTHSAHLYGNIGTTKSTEMLIDEVQARAQYNLYATAARLFADEFLLYIY